MTSSSAAIGIVTAVFLNFVAIAFIADTERCRRHPDMSDPIGSRCFSWMIEGRKRATHSRIDVFRAAGGAVYH